MVQVTVHAPPLPIPYGTHHSKFFILKYATGVRVVIHTANLIFCDCNNKTQGLYCQDFPLLPTGSADGGSSAAAAAAAQRPPGADFGAALLQYVRRLELPAEAAAAVEAALSTADFSAARVALVPSAPGRHRGAALTQFGHMRARVILARHSFPSTFRKAPLACQFSSLGSLTQPWLEREFALSMSAGRVLSPTGAPLPPNRVSLSVSLSLSLCIPSPNMYPLTMRRLPVMAGRVSASTAASVTLPQPHGTVLVWC